MRLSPLTFNSVRMASVATLLHRVNFAGFATIGAVIKPVFAEADGMLRLAIGAILLALAVSLFAVALRANYRPRHGFLLEALLLEMLGHPVAASKPLSPQRCAPAHINPRTAVRPLLWRIAVGSRRISDATNALQCESCRQFAATAQSPAPAH